MLHVAPPCSAPSVLWDSKLSDKTGFVEVDKGTCQHVRFANIFALGDCSNLPTSKTAAAISSQYHILSMNLAEVMAGRSPSHKYDGYTACPLVTKKGLCILAEFGYGGKDLETFPFDQSVPRLGAYVMKVYVMPLLYWHLFITGYWNGPTLLRKIFHLWMKD
ncbi:hypothetical protein NP493_523g01042 [Ridgeia piscesae]|uniref:FAD/NAD(P)-binding domain-containing protein n=1 Tax=Ridgeia piscesae TaxID=27915 RepID=A0AAD9NTK6_RIDPI|nr:hypothetical protein NP493_523g01042 [Ridgeia piscesae]